MDFTRQEERFLRELITREGAKRFAIALVDTMRDIANCEASSDTCVSETCHMAHAIEEGMACHTFSDAEA